MINGIRDKKFVEEQHYPGGVRAYLFRDKSGNCLQVLWLDDGRDDVLVPLPAKQDVDLVRLDGSRATLRAAAGGISLSLSSERPPDGSIPLERPGLVRDSPTGWLCR